MYILDVLRNNKFDQIFRLNYHRITLLETPRELSFGYFSTILDIKLTRKSNQKKDLFFVFSTDSGTRVR